jgi:hypothetical protein
MPSRFAFHAVATTSLLAYLAVGETPVVAATQVQALGCALFRSLIHPGIIFSFQPNRRSAFLRLISHLRYSGTS